MQLRQGLFDAEWTGRYDELLHLVAKYDDSLRAYVQENKALRQRVELLDGQLRVDEEDFDITYCQLLQENTALRQDNLSLRSKMLVLLQRAGSAVGLL